MPIKKVVTLSNFNRGLNTVRPARELQDGELQALLNGFILDGKIRRRPAVKHYPILDGASALMSGVTGLQPLTVSTGTYSLIGLNPTGLTKLVLGGTSVALSDAMSLSPATSQVAWRSVQYRNYGYAVRPNLNYIVRFNTTDFWSTGIAAPATNAAIADGGVGTGEAGSFYGVYTFVDADGVESAPSPVSAVVTVAANRFFAWSSVDVSTNPRVTARKLYRTLPNQTGEYFYVATIPDNIATTYNEAILTTAMGDLAPVDNVVPPSKNYIDIETAFERLWVTEGSYLYGSAAEDPDSFPPENVYAFSPDDGQPIKALRRMNNSLAVLKSGSIWALEHSLGAFEFLPRVVDPSNGCAATASACVGDGFLFYFSGNAIMRSDLRGPSVDVSTGRIAPLSDLSITARAGAIGAIYPRHGWYVITFPEAGGFTLVYDYRRDTWAQFAWRKALVSPGSVPWFATSNILWMKSVIDSDAVPRIYVGFSDSTTSRAIISDVTWAEPSDTNGDVISGTGYTVTVPAISIVLRFKGIDFGMPGLQHSISRVLLGVGAAATTSSVVSLDSVILYGDSYGTVTRSSVTLTQNARYWRNLMIAARANKASVSFLEINYSGLPELVVTAVQIHGEVWNWHQKEGLN